MADIDNIQSNLSTGQMQLPQNDPVVPPAAYQTPTRPVDLIEYQRRLDTQLPSLQFPSDLPKYRMTMDIQSYRRADLFSIGQTQSISFVTLPLPMKMIDSHQIAYDQKRVGPLLGNALNQTMDAGRTTINNALSAAQRANSLTEGAAGVAAAFRDGASGMFTANGVSGAGAVAVGGGVNFVDSLGSEVQAGVRAASGYSGNYFLTVLLDGPIYKTHNFNWQFSARSPAEAESLNRIFRVMNNSMAPGIAFGGAVFTFPRVFRIAYMPNSQYLYKFKPAVLTSFIVDPSGGGVASMYRADGVTNGLNAPVMYNVQAQFLELEYWLRSDFGGDDDGVAGGHGANDPYYTTGPTRDGN